jgi:NAD-dependent deacetylase
MTDDGEGEAGPAVVERIADAVRGATRTVAFTGAGVSAASGVPTFRGEDGVWNGPFDPADFHRSRFDADPAGFWRDRLDLHERIHGADPDPNAAHVALARLESAGHLHAVITQNTDGLHAEAGSTTVELHGDASRVVCEACGETAPAADAMAAVRGGDAPPRCGCGGVYKPDVVLFGEGLGDALSRAQSLAYSADCLLACGSSLTVEPAASLPRLASRSGTLVVVNLAETGCDDVADVLVRGDVTEVLPAVAAELGVDG